MTETIPCPGGGRHIKLPCADCGEHAGGCRYPETPENVCLACGAAICLGCRRTHEQIVRDMNPLNCRECRFKERGATGARSVIRGVVVFGYGALTGIAATWAVWAVSR